VTAIESAPLLYTKEQAAERLGGIVTPYWLRINAAARRIPCTYVGKRLCFSEKNLADLLEQCDQTPKKKPRR
jgi:hypothetical protein